MLKLAALLTAGALFAAGPALAELTTLDQIVVTATRNLEPRSEVAASIAVVTADEIAARGATRLEDVLQDVIGLHLVSQGSAAALVTPSIRGSESQQVLVMIDGIRLNSPQLGLADLSNLPVALGDIERIEVLRGPASALYGSNALGGVIHIITRQPEATPQTRVSWSEGRADSRRVSVSTARKLEKFRYRIGLEKQQSQGFRVNSDYDQFNADTQLGYRLSPSYDLQFNAYHFDRENGTPGTTAFPSPSARQLDRNTLASLTLSELSGPLTWRIKESYERRNNRYRNPDWFIDDSHKVETYGSELQGTLEQNRHTLTLGLDYFLDSLDSSQLDEIDQERGSLFAQYQLDATSMLQLLFGLRYDIHSNFDNELSPRASALFKLSDSTRLRASASKAFRAPTLNDLYWPLTSFPGYTEMGNPDLTPETAWEYEIALDQDLGESGSFLLSTFLRETDGLINWQDLDPDPLVDYWQPVNINDARIWGVETGIDYRFCRSFAAGGNYTWLSAKDRNTDAHLAGKPTQQLHGYLTIGPVQKLTFRLDGRYADYHSSDTTRKSYLVFDASLNRPFVVGQVDLDATLSVRNLLDRDYEINPGYPMPPQEFQLGISAYF